jgi:hypothetical protein
MGSPEANDPQIVASQGHHGDMNLPIQFGHHQQPHLAPITADVLSYYGCAPLQIVDPLE